jgi:hypothetical protein
MRRPLSLLAAAAVGLIQACADQRPLVSDEGPLAWGLGEQPLRVLLGVEDTDNVHLGWVCDPGGVTLISPYDEAGGAPLQLRSGSVEASYLLRPMQDVEGAEATTMLSDPVLQAFWRTGRLSEVAEGGGATPLDARTSAERAAIDRFMTACRAVQQKP